jgi:hypothetical protein
MMPKPFDLGMTGSAINVVALASALENSHGHGKRHVVARIVAELSGIEITIFVQFAPGDSALYRRPLGALVGVEVATGERVLSRLHLHVEPAAGEQSDRNQ